MNKSTLNQVRATLSIVLLALTTSCAEQPQVVNKKSEPLVQSWPAAPEKTRIEYVTSFSQPQDLGINGGTLSWVKRLLFGKRQTQLVRPMAILVDGELIYVADPGARGVHRFDQASGRYQLILGKDRTPLPSPVGLALGNHGRVYLSDSILGQVLTIDVNSKEALEFPLSVPLQQPTGIAFDRATDQLFVTNTPAHQLQIFDAAGNWQQSIGTHGDGDGQFNYPTLLWLANSGLLYITDALNFRVQIFDRSGVWQSMFGQQGDGTGNLTRHKGVATDSYGHVYVVDAIFHAIQVFDKHGNFLLSLGEQGDAPGQFWLPSGIFIDDMDRIYVADSYNRRVQIFRYVGGPT